MKLNLKRQRLGLGLSVLKRTNSGGGGPPGPTVPGAPTGATAVAGDTEADVSFTAPVDDGGSAITGYRVTSTPGSITATGASSPITVTGLTNGVAYTFTVAAENAVGYGAESTPSNSVTPSAAIVPVSFVRSASASGTTVTFTSAAASGQAVVVVAFASTTDVEPTVPSGFNPIVSRNDTVNTGVWSYIKIAGGAEADNYVFTGTNFIVGFILDSVAASPIGNTGSNFDNNSVNSLVCASSAINISEGSMAFAVQASPSGAGGARSFSNSFTNNVSPNARLTVARRSYATADTSENSTASWTSAHVSNRGLLFEIKGLNSP